MIATPVVKWAGGKAKLVHELVRRLPPLGVGARYFEPFAGGAALFFALAPARAVLGDANANLIGLYRALVADVEAVIEALEFHARRHDESHFGAVREHWNAASSAPPARRAAAMLYLNRACFNGLWRVNATGEMNTPIGRRADGQLNEIRVDEDNLRAAAAQLARAELHVGDYRASIADARPGDLVYFDSPYDDTWTGYTADAFGHVAQRQLAETVRDLAAAGIDVVASNADTSRVRELYAGLRIDTVRAPRAINSDPDGRGDVDELLVLAGPAFAPAAETHQNGTNRRNRPSVTTPAPDPHSAPERTHTTMTNQSQTSMTIDETIEDVIERGIRRVLPVKLTDHEFTEIAKRRAVVEAERDDMTRDLDREKSRRKALIEERENDIEKMGRELRTGEQDRTVPCTKVFRREFDGSGWVVTLRNDTHDEVTREPATPAQMQRYLPGVDPEPPSGKPRSVLDEARARQAAEERGAAPAGDSDAGDSADEGDDAPDPDDDQDDGLGIETELVNVGPQNAGELPAKPKKKSRGKGKGKGRG